MSEQNHMLIILEQLRHPICSLAQKLCCPHLFLMFCNKAEEEVSKGLGLSTVW